MLRRRYHGCVPAVYCRVALDRAHIDYLSIIRQASCVCLLDELQERFRQEYGPDKPMVAGELELSPFSVP